MALEPRFLLQTGSLVFFPSGVPAIIAFGRERDKLTLADPNVMLTAKRD